MDEEDKTVLGIRFVSTEKEDKVAFCDIRFPGRHFSY